MQHGRGSRAACLLLIAVDTTAGASFVRKEGILDSIAGSILRSGHPKDVHSISEGVAVCVEPRKHPMLSLVVTNIVANRPHKWKVSAQLANSCETNMLPYLLHDAPFVALFLILPLLQVILFHGNNNRQFVYEDQQLTRLVDNSFLVLQNLETLNTTSVLWNQLQNYKQAYSRLLTSRLFWEKLPLEHVLVFQVDSVLCARSSLRIDDFINYDFVGAPLPKFYWADGLRFGNGGLSLRSKAMMLAAIEAYVEKAGKQYENGVSTITVHTLLRSLTTTLSPTRSPTLSRTLSHTLLSYTPL